MWASVSDVRVPSNANDVGGACERWLIRVNKLIDSIESERSNFAERAGGGNVEKSLLRRRLACRKNSRRSIMRYDEGFDIMIV